MTIFLRLRYWRRVEYLALDLEQDDDALREQIVAGLDRLDPPTMWMVSLRAAVLVQNWHERPPRGARLHHWANFTPSPGHPPDTFARIILANVCEIRPMGIGSALADPGDLIRALAREGKT